MTLVPTDLWLNLLSRLDLLENKVQSINKLEQRLTSLEEERAAAAAIPVSYVDERVDIVFLWADPLVELVGEEYRPFDDRVVWASDHGEVTTMLTDLGKQLIVRVDVLSRERLAFRSLLKPKVLHLSCHGGYLNGQFCLAFESSRGDTLVGVAEYLPADKLKPIISHAVQGVDLVFISACQSESAGTLFLEAGVPNVVAVHSQTRVADKVAINFAKWFYTSLAQGSSVRNAFDFAKGQVAVDQISSCCCSHVHKHNCRWQKYITDLRLQCPDAIAKAHRMHDPNPLCKCEEKAQQIHRSECAWLRDYMKHCQIGLLQTELGQMWMYDGRFLFVDNLPSGFGVGDMNMTGLAIQTLGQDCTGWPTCVPQDLAKDSVPFGQPSASVTPPCRCHLESTVCQCRVQFICQELIRPFPGSTYGFARFVSPNNARRVLAEWRLAKVDPTGRVFKGATLNPFISLSQIRVCCCSPELPHDESLKFLLLPREPFPKPPSPLSVATPLSLSGSSSSSSNNNNNDVFSFTTNFGGSSAASSSFSSFPSQNASASSFSSSFSPSSFSSSSSSAASYGNSLVSSSPFSNFSESVLPRFSSTPCSSNLISPPPFSYSSSAPSALSSSSNSFLSASPASEEQKRIFPSLRPGPIVWQSDHWVKFPPPGKVPRPFFGRKLEMFHLIRKLHDRTGPKLINVYGDMGVGKTGLVLGACNYLYERRYGNIDGIAVVNAGRCSTVAQLMVELSTEWFDFWRVIPDWKGILVLLSCDRLTQEDKEAFNDFIDQILGVSPFPDQRFIIVTRAKLHTKKPLIHHYQCPSLSDEAVIEMLVSLTGTETRYLKPESIAKCLDIVGRRPQDIAEWAPVIRQQDTLGFVDEVLRNDRTRYQKLLETGMVLRESVSNSPSVRQSIEWIQADSKEAFLLLCILAEFPAGLLDEEIDAIMHALTSTVSRSDENGSNSASSVSSSTATSIATTTTETSLTTTAATITSSGVAAAAAATRLDDVKSKLEESWRVSLVKLLAWKDPCWLISLSHIGVHEHFSIHPWVSKVVLALWKQDERFRLYACCLPLFAETSQHILEGLTAPNGKQGVMWSESDSHSVIRSQQKNFTHILMPKTRKYLPRQSVFPREHFLWSSDSITDPRLSPLENITINTVLVFAHLGEHENAFEVLSKFGLLEDEGSIKSELARSTLHTLRGKLLCKLGRHSAVLKCAPPSKACSLLYARSLMVKAKAHQHLFEADGKSHHQSAAQKVLEVIYRELSAAAAMQQRAPAGMLARAYSADSSATCDTCIRHEPHELEMERARALRYLGNIHFNRAQKQRLNKENASTSTTFAINSLSEAARAYESLAKTCDKQLANVPPDTPIREDIWIRRLRVRQKRCWKRAGRLQFCLAEVFLAIDNFPEAVTRAGRALEMMQGGVVEKDECEKMIQTARSKWRDSKPRLQSSMVLSSVTPLIYFHPCTESLEPFMAWDQPLWARHGQRNEKVVKGLVASSAAAVSAGVSVTTSVGSLETVLDHLIEGCAVLHLSLPSTYFAFSQQCKKSNKTQPQQQQQQQQDSEEALSEDNMSEAPSDPREMRESCNQPSPCTCTLCTLYAASSPFLCCPSTMHNNNDKSPVSYSFDTPPLPAVVSANTSLQSSVFGPVTGGSNSNTTNSISNASQNSNLHVNSNINMNNNIMKLNNGFSAHSLSKSAHLPAAAGTTATALSALLSSSGSLGSFASVGSSLSTESLCSLASANPSLMSSIDSLSSLSHSTSALPSNTTTAATCAATTTTTAAGFGSSVSFPTHINIPQSTNNTMFSPTMSPYTPPSLTPVLLPSTSFTSPRLGSLNLDPTRLYGNLTLPPSYQTRSVSSGSLHFRSNYPSSHTTSSTVSLCPGNPVLPFAGLHGRMLGFPPSALVRELSHQSKFVGAKLVILSLAYPRVSATTVQVPQLLQLVKDSAQAFLQDNMACNPCVLCVVFELEENEGISNAFFARFYNALLAGQTAEASLSRAAASLHLESSSSPVQGAWSSESLHTWIESSTPSTVIFETAGLSISEDVADEEADEGRDHGGYEYDVDDEIEQGKPNKNRGSNNNNEDDDEEDDEEDEESKKFKHLFELELPRKLFVGRNCDLHHSLCILNNPKYRFLNVWGAEGSGKRAFVDQLCFYAQTQGAYPHGILKLVASPETHRPDLALRRQLSLGNGDPLFVHLQSRRLLIVLTNEDFDVSLKEPSSPPDNSLASFIMNMLHKTTVQLLVMSNERLGDLTTPQVTPKQSPAFTSIHLPMVHDMPALSLGTPSLFRANSGLSENMRFADAVTLWMSPLDPLHSAWLFWHRIPPSRQEQVAKELTPQPLPTSPSSSSSSSYSVSRNIGSCVSETSSSSSSSSSYTIDRTDFCPSAASNKMSNLNSVTTNTAATPVSATNIVTSSAFTNSCTSSTLTTTAPNTATTECISNTSTATKSGAAAAAAATVTTTKNEDASQTPASLPLLNLLTLLSEHSLINLSRHHPGRVVMVAEAVKTLDMNSTLEQLALDIIVREREAQTRPKIENSPAFSYHLPRELMMEQFELNMEVSPTAPQPKITPTTRKPPLSNKSSTSASATSAATASSVASASSASPRLTGFSHKETLQIDHSVKQQHRERERSLRIGLEHSRARPSLFAAPARLLGRSQSASAVSKGGGEGPPAKRGEGSNPSTPKASAPASNKTPPSSADSWDAPTPSSKRRDRRPPAPARGERTADDPILAVKKSRPEKKERRRPARSLPPVSRHSLSSNSGDEEKKESINVTNIATTTTSNIESKKATRKRMEKEELKEMRDKDSALRTKAGARLSQALGKLDKVLDGESVLLLPSTVRTESVNSSHSSNASLEGAAALQAVLQLPKTMETDTSLDGWRLLRSHKQLAALSKEVDFMWARYTNLNEDKTPHKTRQALVNNLEKNLAKKIEHMISIKEQLLQKQKHRRLALFFDQSDEEEGHTTRPKRSPVAVVSDEEEETIDPVRQKAMTWEEKNDVGENRVRNMSLKVKPVRETKVRPPPLQGFKERASFVEEKLSPENDDVLQRSNEESSRNSENRHSRAASVEVSSRNRTGYSEIFPRLALELRSNSSRQGSGELVVGDWRNQTEDRLRSGKKDKKTGSFRRKRDDGPRGPDQT